MPDPTNTKCIFIINKQIFIRALLGNSIALPIPFMAHIDIYIYIYIHLHAGPERFPGGPRLGFGWVPGWALAAKSHKVRPGCTPCAPIQR